MAPDPRSTDSPPPQPQIDAGYRLLFDRNPWPMWVYDRRTLYFLAVNEAALAGYGYSEAEFLAMRLPDIRQAGEQAALLAYLATPLPRRTPSRHWRHRRRNGELFDVEIVSEAICFNGRDARLVLAKDITQRLQAEAALRDSERRYRRIVETASEGIWAIDALAVTTFVNPKMAQMLGYTVPEMAGRSMTEFMGEPGVALAQHYLGRRRQGMAEQHEFKFRRKDGSHLWAALSTNPVLGDDGAYAGALAMVTDITERKRVETRDASRDQVLTLMAAGAPLADVLAAIVQGIEASHPGLLCSVLLLDASGQHLLRGATGSVPEFFNQAVHGVLIGPAVGSCGTAAHTGQRVICEDIQADVRWLSLHDLAARAGLASCWSEPILSHGGAVLGTFGVYQRVVAQPTDEALAAVAEAARLAAIAIERQRADDALRESQKMESLGTLAGGIAHDFNNILGAMLGNLALATQAGVAPADAAARLAHVRQSALRARHLVHQILAFSRRQPHQAVRQPLAPLIDEAVALLRATLPASVRLQTRLAAEPEWAAVDASQIQQVLINLCTNAWHAMGGAAGQIEIGLAHVAAAPGMAPGGPAGGWAHLRVQDYGHGMDDAVRARIFEPFFTTKPVGSGTGLGLSVVHGIVSEHQGHIVVDSARGRGATFHLYFPATEAAARPPALPGAPDLVAAPVLRCNAEATGTRTRTRTRIRTGNATGNATGTGTGTGTGNATGVLPVRHLLCVDDDAVILLTNEALLQASGFRVTSVGSGREAVAAVLATPDRFDLVVADFNMPEMSGIDVARQIALIRPGLPVVICSGYIDASLRAQANAVGLRALVNKESSAETLARTIRRVLGLPAR